MKNNRSLGISTKIEELKKVNILSFLEKEFPASSLKQFEDANSRNRIFTPINTLMTMVFTSVLEDKSLKNSVQHYQVIHQRNREQAHKIIEQEAEAQRQDSQSQAQKGPGRPAKPKVSLPKSLEQDISQNTAAYSKARKRISLDMVRELFTASRIQGAENSYTHFHGQQVFMADGTYVQLQDTESIKQEYPVLYGKDPYPQGLLEVITSRGTGQLQNFRLANRKTSELPLLYEMMDELPAQSILLLDDLYNCYEIILKAKNKGIDLVMPAKRERKYEEVEKLAEGDEIIRITPPTSRSKWLKKEEREASCDILLRRIECKTPEGNSYVLHTTLLDKSITKEELQLLYLTRWDVEISIREIKMIMDINILRSRSPDMAYKELAVALATYNIIRKITYASIKDLPFSPEENFIHQYYTLNKNLLVDKKGRVYSRWSPGRRGDKRTNQKSTASKTRT